MLGTNLHRLFGLHGLSVAEAARRIGVSRQSASYWVAGHRQPDAEHLAVIATFFEIPADRFRKARLEDLVGKELSDVDRFKRVELKLRG
ncbi:MAG: helix-turn-helix transcriptional regulator [Actinobacteria bacterium]|nr:helix-turn-helix transcriptional regulator [Actinomycetota bacterium]